MENQNQQITVTKSEELQLLEARANAEYALTAAGQMVKTFEVTQRIGGMYAKSTIVPEKYQNNVANCAIAVDVAMHLGKGISPLTVMQNLTIVQGKPTWSAQFLISCINTCGKFSTIRYEEKNLGKVGKGAMVKKYVFENNKGTEKVIKTDEYADVDNLSCVAYAYDDATGEKLTSTEITIKMAMAEGWYAKSGSKWQSMPQQMLRYRAAAFWQRAYAPEVGMGFYTTEEIQDIAPVDAKFTEIRETEPTNMTLAEEAMAFAQDKKKRNKAETPSEPVIFPETTDTPAEPQKAEEGVSVAKTEGNSDSNPKAERTLV